MNRTVSKRALAMLATAALAVGGVAGAQAAERGVTPTEIKVGQTMPYSGPVSAYGTYGRAMSAYMAKVNAEGGINGRKVNLVSLDDVYSPPKTLENFRLLVEQDKVWLVLNPLGTPSNTAIRDYMKALPELLRS